MNDLDRRTSSGPAERAPEIRVFISSTFRDMQAERERLIKRVFPELHRLCRERGVEFTEIDLRWGITEEESRRGNTVKICLEEIDRCRPYFLGILGDRYGWTPRLEDVANDPELLGEYPWVASAIAEGRSVTEMEIMHGVLKNPDMASQTFFYLRATAATAASSDVQEPSDLGRARLAALKDALRRSGRPLRNFPDPETLAQQVHGDLKEVIDRRFPADSTPSPLSRSAEVS